MLPEFIIRLGLNKDMVAFAEQFGTPQQAWDACNRPDWMFWVLARVCADHKALVRLAVDFAELASPASNMAAAGTHARDAIRAWLAAPSLAGLENIAVRQVAVFAAAAVVADRVAASLASSGFAALAARATTPAEAADFAYMAHNYADYCSEVRDGKKSCDLIRAQFPVIPL